MAVLALYQGGEPTDDAPERFRGLGERFATGERIDPGEYDGIRVPESAMSAQLRAGALYPRPVGGDR